MGFELPAIGCVLTRIEMALRILFSVHGYKPAWRIGGPVVSVPALAEALVRRGNEVTVFTTNSNLDEILDVEPNRAHDVDGVSVWYFEKQEPLQRLLPGISYFAKSLGVLYSPRMAEALGSMVAGMDVLHTHLPFIYPTFATAKAAFRNQKPLFYHQRGVFDPERLKFRGLKKKLYLRGIEFPILRKATTLVALTQAEVDSYRRLGVSTPCRVIPNGIDPAQLVLDEPVVELDELHIRSEHTVLLFMGRIHPVKGADRLLESFLQVASEYPNAILVLAGPDEFGVASKFRDRVAATGLGQRVKFPGMVTGQMKKRLLARADLFCLLSDAEGFSMAILEALVTRTAVLISKGCHFDEVAEAGAGVVIEHVTVEIVQALRRILANRDHLRQMGAKGQQLVLERYTWERVAADTIDMYEEGIQRHRVSKTSKVSLVLP